MSTTPSTATISGTVTWSSGAAFDGWLRLGLVLPSNDDGVWPSSVIAGQLTAQRLPIWIEIPITAGVIDPKTTVKYNASLSPPNTKYVAYWHDRNNRRIFPATGVQPTAFTISTNPYAISVPTLTAPSAGTTLTEEPVDTPAVSPAVRFADTETPTGTVNGVNVTFTLANTVNPPASLLLLRNGVMQQATGDYTLAGATITFISVPQNGDILQAWYRY